MIVEVCANSLQSALNAEKSGADRVELCSELSVGGITPSYGLLKKVKENLAIPIHVLIRPRSGDFTYSDVEYEVMLADISQCIKMGCDGIVAGVLHKDFTLDVARTKELVKMAGHLKFTFHRAFDWVKDPIETLAQLEDLGVTNILTSGKQKSVVEGMPLLLELQQKASHNIIMPGGGIRESNVHLFKENDFGAIHLSGIRFHKTLEKTPLVSMNAPSFLKDDEIALSDPELIQKVLRIVK